MSTSQYNVANDNGGAIYKVVYLRGFSRYGDNASILIDNQFLNNTAGGSGGAIYNTGSNDSMIVNDSYYRGNAANAFGGTIYLYFWHK